MNRKTYRVKPTAAKADAGSQTIPTAPVRHRPRESSVAMHEGEFIIAEAFLVRRSNKQHYRLYSIYTAKRKKLLGQMASYPSIFDCLSKLEAALGNSEVSSSEYYTILRSRAVAQELASRDSAGTGAGA